MCSLPASIGLVALGLCLPRTAAARVGYVIDPPEAGALVDGAPATTMCSGSGRITVVFDQPTRIDAVSIPHDLAYVVLELDGSYVAQDYGTGGRFGFTSRLVKSMSLLFTDTCFGELEVNAGTWSDLLAPSPSPQPVILSADVLGRATNDIRALRLALEECDAEALAWWIEFPVTMKGRTYRDGRALSAACRRAQIPLLDPGALEVALQTAGADELGVFRVALDHQWRFASAGGQWWLVGVD